MAALDEARQALAAAVLADVDPAISALEPKLDPRGSPAYIERRRRTLGKGIELLARWLQSGEAAHPDEAAWMSELGAIGARERIPFHAMTRGYLVFRDVMSLRLNRIATEIQTPAQLLGAAGQVLASACDGSIVSMARTYDRYLDATRVALEASEARYRDIVETAQEGIVTFDARGRITFANRRFAEFLGATVDELRGTRLRAYLRTSQSGEWRSAFARFRAGHTLRLDAAFRRADGELVWGSVAGTPLLTDQGEFTGGLAMVADITYRKQAAEELEYRALHDGLTGLPNRALLRDRLAQAILATHRLENLAAVIFMDLDGFKAINDTHGHDVGDHVLVEVGRRLSGVLRGSDTVARMGGDEFAVVIEGAAGAEVAMALARKLLEALRQPIDLSGETVQVGASLGVALCPTHGNDVDTLLRHADAAMYRAKRTGSVAVLYTPTPEPA
ncbi:MAG: GGDEF domain-containing protein [Chloroflexi bacterium]|nr:GGDEF domain-containing protein [Chloroflexota bacterium]